MTNKLAAVTLAVVAMLAASTAITAAPAAAASPPTVWRDYLAPTGDYRVSVGADIVHYPGFVRAVVEMHCTNAAGLVYAQCRTLDIKRQRVYRNGVLVFEATDIETYFYHIHSNEVTLACNGRAQYQSWATFWVRFPDNSITEIYTPLVSSLESSC